MFVGCRNERLNQRQSDTAHSKSGGTSVSAMSEMSPSDNDDADYPAAHHNDANGCQVVARDGSAVQPMIRNDTARPASMRARVALENSSERTAGRSATTDGHTGASLRRAKAPRASDATGWPQLVQPIQRHAAEDGGSSGRSSVGTAETLYSNGAKATSRRRATTNGNKPKATSKLNAYLEAVGSTLDKHTHEHTEQPRTVEVWATIPFSTVSMPLLVTVGLSPQSLWVLSVDLLCLYSVCGPSLGVGPQTFNHPLRACSVSPSCMAAAMAILTTKSPPPIDLDALAWLVQNGSSARPQDNRDLTPMYAENSAMPITPSRPCCHRMIEACWHRDIGSFGPTAGSGCKQRVVWWRLRTRAVHRRMSRLQRRRPAASTINECPP